MSYRNDHDAALARIDALEAELARLSTKTSDADPSTRARPDASTRYARLAGLAIVGAMVGSAGFGFLRLAGGRHAERGAPVVAVAPARPEATRDPQLDALRACADQVLVASQALDASPRDPAASPPRPLDAITATGAGCRVALAEALLRDDLPDETRAALAAWLAAEDTLAGDISRVVVYYGSGPDVLDAYATAPQLWREYRRDLVARDASLVMVRRARPPGTT